MLGALLEFTCACWNSLLYSVLRAGDTLKLRVQVLQPRGQGTGLCPSAAPGAAAAPAGSLCPLCSSLSAQGARAAEKLLAAGRKKRSLPVEQLFI